MVEAFKMELRNFVAKVQELRRSSRSKCVALQPTSFLALVNFANQGKAFTLLFPAAHLFFFNLQFEIYNDVIIMTSLKFSIDSLNTAN